MAHLSKETLGKARVGASRPPAAPQSRDDIGFQVGWLLVGQQRYHSFDAVALTGSGIDQSCAQPSSELGEHMENERLKHNKCLLCLALTDWGTCGCAELLPVVKEDKMAHSHLEIPQPLHVVSSDKRQREMGSVSRLRVILLLHGSRKSRFCNQ